jgi:hypothetical protein
MVVGQTGWKGYSQLMSERPSHLTLKLDTNEPIEIVDFIGAFVSLSDDFDRYVVAEYPNNRTESRCYVQQIRAGCIEADIITNLSSIAMATLAAPVQTIEYIMVLEDFVRRWGARAQALISNKFDPGQLESPRELRDFIKAARAIACDPAASFRLEAATFADEKREVRAEFRFSTPEARAMIANAEDRERLLTKPENTVHRRVLMRYTRTDVHDATINKRSGERVVIEKISEKDFPVIYASEMAERQIRETIREADDNAYKKGFVVDVDVERIGERIVAYSVMNVHQVIDFD